MFSEPALTSVTALDKYIMSFIRPSLKPYDLVELFDLDNMWDFHTLARVSTPLQIEDAIRQLCEAGECVDDIYEAFEQYLTKDCIFILAIHTVITRNYFFLKDIVQALDDVQLRHIQYLAGELLWWTGCIVIYEHIYGI